MRGMFDTSALRLTNHSNQRIRLSEYIQVTVYTKSVQIGGGGDVTLLVI